MAEMSIVWAEAEALLTMMDTPAIESTFLEEFLGHTNAFRRRHLGVMFLLGTAFTLLLLSGIFGAMFGVILLCMVAYGAVFPIAQLTTHCLPLNNFADALLPCWLSFTYAITVVLLAVLVPSVWRFTVLSLDLLPLDAFPPAFFQPCVIAEISRRYVSHLHRISLRRWFKNRVGSVGEREILSYLSATTGDSFQKPVATVCMGSAS